MPQIFADIDTDKMLKLGISPADVNTALGAFLGGAYVNDFNRFGRLFKVYVQAEPEYRNAPGDVRFFFVRNSEGEPVPLSSVVNMTATMGPEYTNRFNLFRAAELTGSPAPGYSSDQALAALREVAAEVLPTDMSYAWNAMSYQEVAAAGSGGQVFLLALLFVFLILAAQYESWSLPFSVLHGHADRRVRRHGRTVPVRAVSDRLREQRVRADRPGDADRAGGKERHPHRRVREDEAGGRRRSAGCGAMTAARDRFRPILMTAFSFILGVIPLLIADRRRRRGPEGDGHDRVRRHDGGNRHRRDSGAGSVRAGGAEKRRKGKKGNGRQRRKAYGLEGRRETASPRF